MLWIIVALLLFISQVPVVLINEYCRPQKAAAWLVVLYLFPFIGFLVYYFVAKEYSCLVPMRPKDKRALDQVKEMLALRCKRRLQATPSVWPTQQDERLQAILRGNAFPITDNNETTIYAEGGQAFDAMLEAISMAKHHIHIEFYIVRDDLLGRRLQQLLILKAQEGVEVRLLYDGIGCIGLKKTYIRRLQKGGVETGCFASLRSAFLQKRINYRNHRKIVVIDGEVGFFGGLNIGDEYLGKNEKIGFWRDTHFRMKGDAVLWIQYTFATDWHSVTGQPLIAPVYYPAQQGQGNELVQVVKSGPDETLLELMFTFVVSAKKRIYMETPYFVLDPGMILALKTASIRGVDIRVIIPAVPDSKLVYLATMSYVRELLQAGIRFYRYRKGFIHAKVIVCDDVACSGSANMDMRSFSGQFEMNAVFFDGKTVDCLIRQFNRDLEECVEILPTEFENQSKSRKAKEVFARLVSPLF